MEPLAGPQTIWADSYRHWGVESTQQAGNTAVETYPCVQKNYNNPPVSSIRLLRNGFTESMPANAKGLDAEAADDVWLNNYSIEVMIWVDNHGQRPSGNVIGHATIFGQHFAVWHGGTDYTFALDHNETTGMTHIQASLKWLISHGYIPASATLTQVNFGVGDRLDKRHAQGLQHDQVLAAHRAVLAHVKRPASEPRPREHDL